MKNKPIRHKDYNTFKFQPFADRIAAVDVDIFHRIAHPNETDSEGIECFFYLCVQKWNVLNLTAGYDTFRKQVYDVITLPQLLYKKDYVVEVLLRHLQRKHTLSLQPLLELVVALAKDLRKEFYPYYSQFLSTLIDLLNTKETDQLEWVFSCLAYLFKYLWKYMIKDIGIIFSSLLPLLSDARPPYINNFAAESFSFVSRKVKDKESFLSLILQTLEERVDGVIGCGKLFFETVKGVTGNFHSCAEATLTFYFESLCNDKLSKDLLFTVLQNMISTLVQNIQTKNCEVFWKTLFTVIDKNVTPENISAEISAHNIELLLKLSVQALEYKNGVMLNNYGLVVKQYLKMLAIEELPENILLQLINLSSLLLVSKNINLPQENSSLIVRKTLQLQDKSIILIFIDKLTSYSSFEALILPVFLRYYSSTLDPCALKLLAKIVSKKSPLSQNGIQLTVWKKYPLEFSSNVEKVIDKLSEFLVVPKDCDFENVYEFMYALICFPHINSINKPNIVIYLKQIFEIVNKNIISNLDENNQQNLMQNMFILSNLVECLVHLSDAEELSEILINKYNLIETLLKCLKMSSVFTISSLKILDMIITSCQDIYVSYETLKMLDQTLLRFFSSSIHQVRLLTTHIYSLFENIPELQLNKTETDQFNVFSICYQVESIEPLIHTYRNQLQLLEKLSFDKSQGILCKNTEFATVPLRYFLGCLYIHFQLLWDPVINLIETYSHGMNMQKFWDIFSIDLKYCVEKIRKIDDSVKIEDLYNDVEFVGDLYNNLNKVDNKPDFVHYRILLWKAMVSFPDIAQARSKDISALMLSFIEDEYRNNNSTEALTWNIKQITKTDENNQNIEDEDVEKEDDEVAVIKKQLNSQNTPSGKSNLKTLLTTLNVFAKIRSPKAMYREPELYKLYLDLLSHRNAEVQKTALDCIMVYKHKYLTPYRDNLYSLVDDKKFKNELASFRIDKETTVVQSDHRKDLIPLVLRIVHSKMMAKTGLRTGGKASGQLRRSLVLRFLAGCHEDEMIKFIHMSFKYYAEFVQDDVEIMVEYIVKNINLEKYTPPKRLQSTLNLLLVILEQFGRLMGNELLGYLLKILLIVGSSVLGAFEQKSLVHAGYLSSLRNIRTMCQTIVGRFFNRFEKYPWSDKELNAVFNVFIWPWLEKFTMEGIHSPTALLKLFHQWAMNPRYFILLVKHQKMNPNMFVLPEIVKLLLAPKVHPSVTNTILEMLEKLLLLKPDEEDTAYALKLEDIIPVADNILERLKISEINYGSCILLPFVPNILERFKRKLSHKSKGVNHKELFIMSRISELVWEPETCHIVLSLVLPMAVKKASVNASDETILQMVQTIYNLIKTVKEPHKHLRKLAPLFCEVKSTQTRKLLCEVLKTISENCMEENVKTAFNVVKELNAFDKKWLDQPDFDRRQDAFKLIGELIKSDQIEFELGAIIIYNCFYLIRNETDLALRESARSCLRMIITHLVGKYKSSQSDKDHLINDICFPIIRKGFKSRNEHYRHESISLLGHMARECSDANIVLRDLAIFASKQDLEVDFFENLVHLQLYRQTRALNRFNNICKELLVPLKPRSSTQFILPLVSMYLLSERFASKNSLIDAAIETVKSICHMLPWHHYESILKYYLGQLRYKLDYQKQLVKLTVAILDAYHYDLSKGIIFRNNNNKQEPDETIVEMVVDTVSIKESKDTDQEDEDNDTQREEPDIDEILEEVAEEIDEEEPLKVVNVPVLSRQTILCPSAAKRVIYSIRTILLPQLHKALAEMTQHEGSHKVNRKRTGVDREEAELQKVPIALAVVKLLQKLPVHILERNLPGVFMKTCTFLKSHLDSVRRVTRETLQKIMTTLGPKYLGLLISEMTSLLSRGFQVHVLVYTIHSILVALKDFFQATDVDKCLISILDVCKVDLFGQLADEKDVAKIINKTSEAKSTKSYDTFQILAQFITEKCLLDLLLPLKDVLLQSFSLKVVNKVQECLRRVVLGLVDNTFIPVETLLVFAYGTSSESIPQFMESTRLNKGVEKGKKEKEMADCFIIPKLPVYRSGFRANNVRNSLKTNAHLLVEFGLRLCFFVLKRDKVKIDNYLKYIDSFIPVFKNCLTSRHVKMCTLTIQCLSWVMRYDLPAMRKNIEDIAGSMFELLHKYAAAGLSKGDNFDLVVAAFKAMAILVREVSYYTVTTDQLKILLIYAEQDLHDFDRQATAFGLLKAIINRKLIIPEIHDVMNKVAELSITSEHPHVRLQSRQVFHQFLMEYPLGKKLDTHLVFYMSQLNYETQPGRESALEMIFGIVTSFPIKVLKKQAGMFFVILGARLINDDSPECRKMVAKCIQTMFERLDKLDRNNLFDVILSWFKDKKVLHKRLAAQLCGILISVEKLNFTSRLPEITPIIKIQLYPQLENNTPGKFVKKNPPNICQFADEDDTIKPRDHHLFQILQMLLKLCTHCPCFLDQTEDVETISKYAQTLLAYPHEWVRISSAQFIGFVLSRLKIDHLSNLLVKNKFEDIGYLYSDPENTIRSLTLDLCAQLQPGTIKPEMAEQIIKNLVFLARVLQKMPISSEDKKEEFEDKEEIEENIVLNYSEDKRPNLLWLTKRMRKIVNREIVEAPKSSILRTEIFKWIAGVVTTVETEKLKQVLNHLLSPLVREMSTTEEDNLSLRQLAKEVGGLLKKTIGSQLYISTMSKLQMHLNARRAERKRERMQLVITNPDIAAKKKIKLQVRKKDAKKRKMEGLKGKKPMKKRKRYTEMDDVDTGC